MDRSCIPKLALGLFSLIVLAGTEAKAAFTYESSPTISTHTGGSVGGSTVGLVAVGSATLQTTPTFENLFNVTLTSSTVPPATDSFTITFSDAITITNVPPPGNPDTKTLTITGSITFTRSDSFGEVSFLTIDPGQNLSVMVDSQLFTLSQFSYTPPTVNSTNGSGNVSAYFSTFSAPVPEPASFAMLGLGMAGVGIVAHRRRRLS